MKNPARLRIGEKDGRTFLIDEVERGLACQCKCPGCGHRLIARKGKKRVPHFAHYRGVEIETCRETSLHKLAKEILEEDKRITIPGYEHVFEPKMVPLEKVSLEDRIESIVPDIIAYCHERPLLIEIAVTHFIDDLKTGKIRSLGISAIEIDLHDFDRFPSREDIRQVLIHGIERKKWIFNQKVEGRSEEMGDQQQAKLEESRRDPEKDSRQPVRSWLCAVINKLKHFFKVFLSTTCP